MEIRQSHSKMTGHQAILDQEAMTTEIVVVEVIMMVLWMNLGVVVLSKAYADFGDWTGPSWTRS